MRSVQQQGPVEVEFRPIEFQSGEKLSVSEYEQRRNQVTQQKLNELMTSKEYRKWVKETTGTSLGAWRAEMCIVCVGLLLGCFLAQQPQTVLNVLERMGAIRLSSSASESADQDVNELAEQAAVAKVLSAKLQEKEQELATQLDRSAQLELSLWSAEHHLQTQLTEVPSMADILLSEANSSRVHVRHSTPGSSQSQLLVVCTGIVALIVTAGIFFHQMSTRRSVVAAKAQARQLQQKIDAAIEAQAASDQQVKDVQALMSAKGLELCEATTAKHIAEAQVSDLQHRILELQQQPREPQRRPAGLDFECVDADEERQAMAGEVEQLQQAIAERDSDLLTLNRELAELADRLPREVQERDEAVRQVRQWLDQAQGQLQNTQTALNVKENECRDLEVQLDSQKSSTTVLQEALEAAKQRELELEKQQEVMRGEMQARVASVMDLMKTTRLSLSQKLLQSRSTCDALAQELAARDAASRSEAGSPRVDVLREASSAFKGFVSSPRRKSSGKGENAAPMMTPEASSGSLKPLSSAKHSRSPYWFAKSQ